MKTDTREKLIQDVQDGPSRRGFLLAVGWIGFLFFSFLAGLLTMVDFYKPKVLFGPSNNLKQAIPMSIRWARSARGG